MPTFEITEPVQRATSRVSRLLLLVGTGIIVTAAQVIFLIDNHSAKDIIVTIVAGSLLIWGASYLWRLEEQPIVAFVEVIPDGIRIRDTHIYDVFLPYPKIKSIRVKETITLRDNIRDSFSWDGRSTLQGRHVIVECRRLVQGGRPILPFKVFRFKVADPDALVSLANEYAERYRGLPA